MRSNYLTDKPCVQRYTVERSLCYCRLKKTAGTDSPFLGAVRPIGLCQAIRARDVTIAPRAVAKEVVSQAKQCLAEMKQEEVDLLMPG